MRYNICLNGYIRCVCMMRISWEEMPRFGRIQAQHRQTNQHWDWPCPHGPHTPQTYSSATCRKKENRHSALFSVYCNPVNSVAQIEKLLFLRVKSTQHTGIVHKRRQIPARTTARRKYSMKIVSVRKGRKAGTNFSVQSPLKIRNLSLLRQLVSPWRRRWGSRTPKWLFSCRSPGFRGADGHAAARTVA